MGKRMTYKTLMNPLAHPPNARFPISVYPIRLLSVKMSLASNFALLVSLCFTLLGHVHVTPQLAAMQLTYNM